MNICLVVLGQARLNHLLSEDAANLKMMAAFGSTIDRKLPGLRRRFYDPTNTRDPNPHNMHLASITVGDDCFHKEFGHRSKKGADLRHGHLVATLTRRCGFYGCVTMVK